MNDAKIVDLEAFILIGGLSRRMGTPKHTLMFGATTTMMTAHIAATLKAVTPHRVRLVAHDDEIFDARLAQLNHVTDLYEERSALTGIHAALAHASAAWVAVVACDLPFVTSDLFVRLNSLRSSFNAVVPLDEARRLQPLCALYRRVACLASATTLLDAGERRAGALLESVTTRFVTHDELADLDARTNLFFNVNTPEDYKRARAMQVSA